MCVFAEERLAKRLMEEKGKQEGGKEEKGNRRGGEG
jgi:hypothetical protein